MKKTRILLCLLLSFFLIKKASAEIITTVNYKGKTYHIDVINTSTASKTSAEVWMRTSDKASSVDDKKLYELTASKADYDHYLKLTCRAKNIMNDGRTIVGCVAVVGSAFCVVGTETTAGMAALICNGVWVYTEDRGAADCLKGLGGMVAEYLGKKNEWKVIETASGLKDPKLYEAISKAVDYMCDNTLEE